MQMTAMEAKRAELEALAAENPGCLTVLTATAPRQPENRDALRVLGAEVCEGWELEEGEKKLDATQNRASVLIQLNEGI